MALTGRAGKGAGPAASSPDDSGTATQARHLDPVFGRRFAERALDALAVVRGSRVADVACATGVFARLSSHVAGPTGEVVGVDTSAAALDTARRIDLTSTVEWVQWDGTALPFETAAFDVVACQHALHRLEEPTAVIAEMGRALVPGGRLGITTWGPIEENPTFAAQLDAAIKSGIGGPELVDVLLEPFAWHDADAVVELARNAGFVDVTCRTVRVLAALPRVAEWVRVYPSLPPLAAAWHECDQQARIGFLSRATELLRPFEHQDVLRVQASSRLVVARAPSP